MLRTALKFKKSGFYLILLATYSASAASPLASKAQLSKPPAREQKHDEPTVLDWLAFGSACNASQSKPHKDVHFEASFEKALVSTFKFNTLQLLLDKKDKGLAECALRVSVQPPPKTRIASVVARTQLVAFKDDSTHLRARLLLLLGETLLAQRTWELKPQEFAKNREQEVVLASGEKAVSSPQQTACGQPQIIGLDYTFEGVRKNDSKTPATNKEKPLEPAWLKAGRVNGGTSARIEIFFEAC